MKKIIGYHGTTSAAEASVLANGFRRSIGDNEWLGKGCYFFIDGINDRPDKLAEQWAIDQAWNNRRKTYYYNSFTVLCSIIEVNEEEIWDLTETEGAKIFHYVAEKYKRKLAKFGSPNSPKDGRVIDLAINSGFVSCKVVLGNVYIKFGENRKLQLSYRLPNCTICSVRDPEVSIISTERFSRGEVKS